MAEIPERPGSEPRFTGSREGAQQAYQKGIDSESARGAAWLASLSSLAVGAHLFGRKTGVNIIAELIDISGFAAKKAGGFFTKKIPGTTNPLVGQRLSAALDSSMTTKDVFLRTRGGASLSEVDSIQDLIEALGVIYDPKHSNNRAGLEEGFKKYFQSFPNTLQDQSRLGSMITHDMDLLTFGDLLDNTQNFFKGTVTNKFGKSKQPLALAAITDAVHKGWITPNTVVDPKLFKAASKGATESLGSRIAHKLSSVGGELKQSGKMGGRLIDLRSLNALHKPRGALDKMSAYFDPMGLVKNTASLFKSRKNIAMLGRDKPGAQNKIFIGGDVFEIPRTGSLVKVASKQRLGETGDTLHRASVLRGMKVAGKLGEAYKGPSKNPGLLERLQHKTGIGTEFQEHAGGLLRSTYMALKGAKAYGSGDAKFVARQYRLGSGKRAQALIGDQFPFEQGLQILEAGKYASRAGKEISGKELGFFGRLSAYAGANPDVAFVKSGSLKRRVLGNKDLFFPDKGGGLKSLTNLIGKQASKGSLTPAGSASPLLRADHYASSGNIVDKTYDFANYMAIRLNSLASSSMLGIGFRPSGSLAANVTRLAAIPSIYMAGHEVLKYADFEIGEITGTRPSELVADAYTSARVAQQQIREGTGIRAGANYFEQVLPGLDAGAIGTIGAAGALLKTLEKTGSAKTALKIGGAIYGLFGGPDVAQTSESLKKEYSGEEQVAIRKARFWGLGFQPFKGGEISHFEPSWYQKLKKKPIETNIYGSEENYWAHGSFLPNARNWLGLRSVVDPYWVERENYENRPYPVTSPFGSEIPIIGPLVADTIGSIIKPRVRMHEGEAQAALTANLSNRGAPADIASHLGIPSLALAQGEMGNQQQIATRLKKYANVALEPTGIWKFALNFFGIKLRDDFEEATSQNIDSIARRFYGSNIGGGIGQTEFIRRFIMSDYGSASKINAQINSIANTMPRWLPGRHSNFDGDRNSYYDFTVGDAYSKLEGGEYRLPGKGYEALHQVHGIETKRKDQEVTFEAQVVKVIDGDTVDVKVGGRTQRVRLAEAFAPETGTSAGQESKNALSSALKPGQKVSVTTSRDVFGSGQETGPYGRTIATIHKNGANVNKAMIDSGHAKHVDSKYDAVDRLLILSDVAPNSQAYKIAEAEVGSMTLSPEWQQKVETAKSNALKKKDKYGFNENYQEDIAAKENLGPIAQSVRKNYLSLHENVLSEIPLIGSKVFPKRDPVGHYRKFQVEGDNFADWTNPYETIVRPAIYDVAGDNPIMGAVKGASLGILMSTQMGKFLNPFKGATAPGESGPLNLLGIDVNRGMLKTATLMGAGASTARAIGVGRLEGGYVPGHVEEERELKEYFDKIKYVKYRNLYEMGMEAGDQTVISHAQKSAKNTILYSLYELKKAGNVDGYRSALTKDERNYFDAFLNTPDRKDELFSVIPDHMKEALSAAWGGGGGENIAPDRQAEEYFDSHALPGSSWMGWHPDVSDSAMQIKMIEGGINGISDNIHRFNFFPGQSLEANAMYGDIPNAIDDIRDSSENMELPWKIRQRGGRVLSEFNFGSGPLLHVANVNLEDSRKQDTFYFMNYIR